MNEGIRCEVTGGIARLRMNWPESLNVLDPGRLQQLDEAWQWAESRSPEAIELSGAGDAFCAGVDTRWILGRMEADRLVDIVDFVRAGHRFLRRVDTSPATTILRLDGHAVGAGAEFACAFDHVVATPRGSLRFPETGIGIHPAMGGTQRLPRRIGLPAARWLVLTGRTLRAREALELGWIAQVVEADALDATIEAVAEQPTGRPWLEARPPAVATETALLRAFASRSLAELLAGAHEGDPAEIVDATRRLRSRAPIALRIADQLLRTSRDVTLDEGLAAEIRELPTVYATTDAFTGMRAAVAGRRSAPFEGR